MSYPPDQLPTVTITIERGVEIPMRDGVILRAEVTRPAVGHAVPVILLRSPYPEGVARSSLDPVRVAEAGIAVVSQQVRGTGGSDGDFEPWRDEPQDGFDTVQWCAEQPWSTGVVGMCGPSYLSHTQLFAAGEHPPALKALALAMVPADPYQLTYVGGALALGSALGWAMGRLGDQLFRRAMAGEDVANQLDRWTNMMSSFDALCRTTPLREIPLLAETVTAWTDWLDHPHDDDWWQQFAVPAEISVPTMIVGGWYDVFLRGTLSTYAAAGRSASLLIGPWAHGLWGQAIGQVDYGFTAGSGGQDLQGQQLAFLAAHLLPGRPPDKAPPVRIFVMGANVWRDEQEWPLARAVETRFYLHEGGLLSAAPPSADERPSTYRFDPRDPVPTIGGATLMMGHDGGYNVGGSSQAALDSRPDILRFLSPPLPHDLEVTGEVSVTLHAASSAPDTDWTAKLVDVTPCGATILVSDGIVRARHRDGSSRPAAPLVPEHVHRFTIDLVATSIVFQAGHQIRVDISSSNFPRFDRNPGTGGLSANVAETEFSLADQTVFHHVASPSWVTLPVVP